MTVLELIDRVLSRLGEPNIIFGPEIEAALPTCLNRFGDLVSKTVWQRNLLEKDFTVTVASGVGDMTTALTASEPLIIEGMPNNEVFLTGVLIPAQYLPELPQLKLDRPKLVAYYTVHGSSLFIRNTDGSLTSYTGTVTIHGSYIPAIASVPDQLKDMFVDVVVDYLQPQPAQPEQPK